MQTPRTFLSYAARGLATVLLVISPARGLLAQTVAHPTETAAATFAFEVATIKPSLSNTDGTRFGFSSNFHFEARNVTLSELLKESYGLSSGSDDQLLGGPAWIRNSHWDVEAKPDEASTLQMQKVSNEERIALARTMLKELLTQRFQLKVHRETRELRVDALTVAKGGAKLEQFANASNQTGRENWRGLHLARRGSLEARGIPLSLLTSVLASQPEVGGRLIVDQTNLAERYSFKLDWTPEDGKGPREDGKDAPSLFTALSQQLGLQIQPKKAPVEVLLIDSAEQPSEN